MFFIRYPFINRHPNTESVFYTQVQSLFQKASQAYTTISQLFLDSNKSEVEHG